MIVAGCGGLTSLGHCEGMTLIPKPTQIHVVDYTLSPSLLA